MKILTGDDAIFYNSDSSYTKSTTSKVLIPENIDELRVLIKKQYENSEPYYIAGGRTATTGGSISDKYDVISLEYLNQITSFDEKSKTIWCNSGTSLKQINEFAIEKGLFLPVNPTEQTATIGGNISTNATGSRSFKFKSMKYFAKSLRILLSNGEEIVLERKDFQKLDNFDYDNDFKVYERKFKGNREEIDNFIGTEGSLGIITDVEIQLFDKPSSISYLLIFFEYEKNCFEIRTNLKSELLNSNSMIFQSICEIEFMNYTCLDLLKKDYNFIPESAKAALIIGLDNYSTDEPLDKIELIMEIAKKYTNLYDSSIYEDSLGKQLIKQMRYKLPVSANERYALSKIRKIASDTVVPENKFLEHYNHNCNLIEENKLNYIAFGHFGDCHLHFNLFPNNEVEFERAIEVFKKLNQNAIDLGGNPVAEHGFGKLKSYLLKSNISKNDYDTLIALKHKYDPRNLIRSGIRFEEL